MKRFTHVQYFALEPVKSKLDAAIQQFQRVCDVCR